MSEIDVSKCADYCNGICYIEEYGGATDAYCERNKDCYYKQFQQLKAENKHLNDLLNSALKEKEQLELYIDEITKSKRSDK